MFSDVDVGTKLRPVSNSSSVRRTSSSTLQSTRKLCSDHKTGLDAEVSLSASRRSPLTQISSQLFRVPLSRPLRLPCRCGRLIDSCGHHDAACTQAGVLAGRGVPFGQGCGTYAPRGLCERQHHHQGPRLGPASAKHPTGSTIESGRLLGCPCWVGHRWRFVTTLISALHCDGSARRGAADDDGVALRFAFEKNIPTQTWWTQRSQSKLWERRAAFSHGERALVMKLRGLCAEPSSHPHAGNAARGRNDVQCRSQGACALESLGWPCVTPWRHPRGAPNWLEENNQGLEACDAIGSRSQPRRCESDAHSTEHFE